MSTNIKSSIHKYQKKLKFQISFLVMVSVLSAGALIFSPQQINASEDKACAQGYVDGFQDGKKLSLDTMEPPYSPRSDDPSYVSCYDKGYNDASLD
jgi:hypothetical protein